MASGCAGGAADAVDPVVGPGPDADETARAARVVVSARGTEEARLAGVAAATLEAKAHPLAGPGLDLDAAAIGEQWLAHAVDRGALPRSQLAAQASGRGAAVTVIRARPARPHGGRATCPPSATVGGLGAQCLAATLAGMATSRARAVGVAGALRGRRGLGRIGAAGPTEPAVSDVREAAAQLGRTVATQVPVAVVSEVGLAAHARIAVGVLRARRQAAAATTDELAVEAGDAVVVDEAQIEERGAAGAGVADVDEGRLALAAAKDAVRRSLAGHRRVIDAIAERRVGLDATYARQRRALGVPRASHSTVPDAESVVAAVADRALVIVRAAGRRHTAPVGAVLARPAFDVAETALDRHTGPAAADFSRRTSIGAHAAGRSSRIDAIGGARIQNARIGRARVGGPSIGGAALDVIVVAGCDQTSHQDEGQGQAGRTVWTENVG